MKFSRGQSLVEVIVAVGMISIVMVAILTAISLSIKNSRFSRDRSQAVALAQEGVELMRAYRDANMANFISTADEGVSHDLPENWIVTDGLATACGAGALIEEIFQRCVDLHTLPDPNEYEALVTVIWKEGSRDQVISQLTQLNLWER